MAAQESDSFDVVNAGASVVGVSAESFWTTEKEWQTSVLGEHFDVVVSDPKQEGSMFRSWTTYLITSVMGPETHSCRRRFSDFDWMRDVLVVRFHGMAIPLLPPKRAVNNSDATFIAERMEGLHKWLVEVVGNPYLRSDTTLKAFLTTVNSTEFDQVKKAVNQGGGGANPAENIGLARWFGVLRSYPLPEDHPAAVSELESMVAKLDQTLESTLSAVEVYHDAASRLDASMADLQRSLKGFADTADSVGSSMSETLTPSKAATADLHEQLVLGAKAFHEVEELAHFAPNELDKFIVHALRQEQRSVGALQALLEVRRAAEAEATSAFKAQDKLQFEEKQLKEKGKDEALAKLRPRVVEACSITQRMQERVADITKGLLNYEAQRNCQARLDNIKAMLGQYATLGIASGERTQQVWTTLLHDAGLDQATMLARAQAVLQGKAVPVELGGLPGPATGGSVPAPAPAAAATAATAAGDSATPPPAPTAPVEGGDTASKAAADAPEVVDL